MQTEIKFSRETTAYGRNGHMACVGMDFQFPIATKDGDLSIRPINTKAVGNGRINIPLEDVPKLMYALNVILTLYQEYENVDWSTEIHSKAQKELREAEPMIEFAAANYKRV